jgi:hypothetical protein
MSRHLTEYNVVPAGAVVRINLAWEASLEQLEAHLAELTHYVFLDVPVGRVKPPVQSWQPDLVELVKRHRNIWYVGVSNVGEPDDLMFYLTKLPRRVVVVPKIESVWACQNIRQIEQVLRPPKTIMLDHDDLFHDMVQKGESPGNLYANYIDGLVDFCRRNDIRLLRTAGVVFSDK